MKIAGWAGQFVPEPWLGPLKATCFSALAAAGWRYRVTRYEGRVKGSGERGSVVAAEPAGWMGPYWRGVLFDGETREEAAGTCTVYGLAERLRAMAGEADLCFGLAPLYLADRLGGEEMLRLPAWVGHRLEVPADEAGRRRVLGRVEGDTHMVKKAGFTWELDGGAASVATYHGEYYAPTIDSRHGTEATRYGLGRLRREMREGGTILWVKEGERRLGGVFLLRREGGVVVRAIGVEGGEMGLIKRGVLAACYVFTFRVAGEMGWNWIDYRGTRPSQADGVFRYKQKWGMTLYAASAVATEEMAAYWTRPSAAVERFLTGYGPVFRRAGGLGAVETGKWRVPGGAAGVSVEELREASGVRRGRGGSGR